MEDKAKTSGDKTPRVDRLWISNTGRTSCDEHGGQYLSAALGRFPRRGRHDTPLDCWEAIKASRKNLYHPEDIEVLACEDSRCRPRL